MAFMSAIWFLSSNLLPPVRTGLFLVRYVCMYYLEVYCCSTCDLCWSFRARCGLCWVKSFLRSVSRFEFFVEPSFCKPTIDCGFWSLNISFYVSSLVLGRLISEILSLRLGTRGLLQRLLGVYLLSKPSRSISACTDCSQTFFVLCGCNDIFGFIQ